VVKRKERQKKKQKKKGEMTSTLRERRERQKLREKQNFCCAEILSVQNKRLTNVKSGFMSKKRKGHRGKRPRFPQGVGKVNETAEGKKGSTCKKNKKTGRPRVKPQQIGKKGNGKKRGKKTLPKKTVFQWQAEIRKILVKRRE